MPDDSCESVIRNRIDVYKAQTAVVADHYRRQGKFRAIRGTGSIEEIFRSICCQIDPLLEKRMRHPIGSETDRRAFVLDRGERLSRPDRAAAVLSYVSCFRFLICAVFRVVSRGTAGDGLFRNELNARNRVFRLCTSLRCGGGDRVGFPFFGRIGS